MKTGTIILLSVILIIIIFLIILGYYAYTVTSPKKGNCGSMKRDNPNVKWSKNCNYIQELKEDFKNIVKPSEPLKLLSFTKSQGMGPPIGANVWYRYRYVDSTTGNYGRFSPWSGGPIRAGASLDELPCAVSCKKIGINSQEDTCEANLIKLMINNIRYRISDPSNTYYANVHRYVENINERKNSNKPPKEDEIDKDREEIVGYLIPYDSTNKAWFIDSSKSPCKVNGINCRTPGC